MPLYQPVTGSVIADQSVGTADLADGAVTSEKLATTLVIDGGNAS